MRVWRSSGRSLWLMTLAITFLVVLPATSLAQGRGRGRGRESDWKCGKFVNCHDARDGRVDGRGPERSNSVFRNYGYGRQYRNRTWNRYDANRTDRRYRYRNMNRRYYVRRRY